MNWIELNYTGQIEEVADTDKSYQWLEKANLKYSIETFIMEAHEQLLWTSTTDQQHQTGPQVQPVHRGLQESPIQ